jgi:hypothetical protein
LYVYARFAIQKCNFLRSSAHFRTANAVAVNSVDLGPVFAVRESILNGEIHMPQIVVAGGIIVAFLALWWITNRIGYRDRKKNTKALMQQENSELRHIVMEMAKERHSLQNDNHRRNSH